MRVHLWSLVLLASTAGALPALAHIELDSPTPRYSNTPSEQNKRCPCGAGAGNQSCSNATKSDPNRNLDAVTTFTPGQTITVRWTETIGHTGRFRVAFDNDGADLADFNAHILADIPDPSNGSGSRSVDVTLPNEPCNNCTLQLLQIMNGNTTNPVADPTGSSNYFQCADITIAAPGGEGEGEGEGEGDVGEGEGEGEGEGDVGEGEGEGDVGEGEGDVGEGEGDVGEGEGDVGEGEGEGEGEGPNCGNCDAGNAFPALLAPALLLLRRRSRRLA